jgi:hypothetical protein
MQKTCQTTLIENSVHLEVSENEDSIFLMQVHGLTEIYPYIFRGPWTLAI